MALVDEIKEQLVLDISQVQKALADNIKSLKDLLLSLTLVQRGYTLLQASGLAIAKTLGSEGGLATALGAAAVAAKTFYENLKGSEVVTQVVSRLAPIFAAIRTSLTGVAAVAATAFTAIGVGVKAYASDLGAVGSAVKGFTDSQKGLQASLQETVVATGRAAGSTKTFKDQLIFFAGEVFATAVLGKLADYAALLSDKLNPSLVGVTGEMDRQSEATILLNNKIAELAKVVQRTQNEALGPLRDVFTEIVSALVPTNRAFVAAIAQIAAYASAALSLVSVVVRLTATLSILGIAVQGVNFLLGINAVKAFIASLGVATTAVTSLTGALALLRTVLVASIVSGFTQATAVVKAFVTGALVLLNTEVATLAALLGLSAGGLSLIVGTVVVGAFLLFRQSLEKTKTEVEIYDAAISKVAKHNKELADSLQASVDALRDRLRQSRVETEQLAQVPGGVIDAAALVGRERILAIDKETVELKKQTKGLSEEQAAAINSLVDTLQAERRGYEEIDALLNGINAKINEGTEAINRQAVQRKSVITSEEVALEERRLLINRQIGEAQSKGPAFQAEAIRLDQELRQIEVQRLDIGKRLQQVDNEAVQATIALINRESALLQTDEARANILDRQQQREEAINRELVKHRDIVAEITKTLENPISGSRLLGGQRRERLADEQKIIQALEEEKVQLAEVSRTQLAIVDNAKAYAKPIDEATIALRAGSNQLGKIAAQQKDLNDETAKLAALYANTRQQVQLQGQAQEVAGQIALRQLQNQGQLVDLDRQRNEIEQQHNGTLEVTLQTQRRALDLQKEAQEIEQRRLENQRAVIRQEEDILRAQLSTQEALLKLETERGDVHQETKLAIDLTNQALTETEAKYQAVNVAVEGVKTRTRDLEVATQRLTQFPLNFGSLFAGAISDGLDAAVLGTRELTEVFETAQISILRTFTNMFAEMAVQKIGFDTIWQNNWLKDIPGFVQGGLSKAAGFISSFFGGTAQAAGSSLSGGAPLLGGLFGGGGGGTNVFGGTGGVTTFSPGTSTTSVLGSQGVPGFGSVLGLAGGSAGGANFGAGIGGGLLGSFAGKGINSFFGIGQSKPGLLGSTLGGAGGGIGGAVAAGAILGAAAGPIGIAIGAAVGAVLGSVLGGVLGDLFKPGRIATERKEIEGFQEGVFGFNVPLKRIDDFLPKGRKTFEGERAGLTALGTSFALESEEGGIGTVKRFGNLAQAAFQQEGLSAEEAQKKVLELAQAIGFDLNSAIRDLNKALGDGFADKDNQLSLKEYREEVKEGQKDITTLNIILKGTLDILTGFDEKFDTARIANGLLADQFVASAKATKLYNVDVEALAKQIRDGKIPIEEAIIALNKLRKEAGLGSLDLKDFKLNVDSLRIELLKMGIVADEKAQKILDLGDAIDQATDHIKALKESIDQVNIAIRDINITRLKQAFEFTSAILNAEGASPLDILARERVDVIRPGRIGQLLGTDTSGIKSEMGLRDLLLGGGGENIVAKLDQDKLNNLQAFINQFATNLVNEFQAKFEAAQTRISEKLEKDLEALGVAAEKTAEGLNKAADAEAKRLEKAFEASTETRKLRVEQLQKEGKTVQETAQKNIDALNKQLQIAQSFQQLAVSVKQTINNLLGSGVSPLSQPEQFAFFGRQSTGLRSAFDRAKEEDRPQAFNELQQNLLQQISSIPFQRPSADFAEIFNGLVKQLEDLQKIAQSEGDKVDSLQKQILAVATSTDIRLETISKQIEAEGKAVENERKALQLKVEQLKEKLDTDLLELQRVTEESAKNLTLVAEAELATLRQALAVQLERQLAVLQEINEAIADRQIKLLEEQRVKLEEEVRKTEAFRERLLTQFTELTGIVRDQIAEFLKQIRDAVAFGQTGTPPSPSGDPKFTLPPLSFETSFTPNGLGNLFENLQPTPSSLNGLSLFGPGGGQSTILVQGGDINVPVTTTQTLDAQSFAFQLKPIVQQQIIQAVESGPVKTILGKRFERGV